MDKYSFQIKEWEFYSILSLGEIFWRSFSDKLFYIFGKLEKKDRKRRVSFW